MKTKTEKSLLSPAARAVIVARANETITNCPTPEARGALQSVYAGILMATNSYNGYNFAAWLNGGYDAWVAAGKPADNTRFLGDQSMIVFY